MQPLGIGVNELMLILFIVVFAMGLPIVSLLDLAKKNMGGTSLAVWALLICVVPVLGSLAYWIVKPTAESRV